MPKPAIAEPIALRRHGGGRLVPLHAAIDARVSPAAFCAMAVGNKMLRPVTPGTTRLRNLDAFEILDDAERKIFEITESHLQRSFQGMDRAVRDALEYIEAIHSQKERKFSVETGF